MTKTIERRISLAAKAASLSRSKFQVGCTIYKGARQLSVGRNQMKKTHRGAMRHYDFPYPHAEFNALKSIHPDNIKNCVVYVARLDKTGSYAMAKPCKCCQQMLREAGIKTVYYTTSNGIERINL